MPSWAEVVAQFKAIPADQKAPWLQNQLLMQLNAIAALRQNRNVIVYFSAFLQKPGHPFHTSITLEDINGMMASLHGLDCTRQLTLVLHSPGGDIGAAHALASYLHAKFDYIEVIVPTYAMSAATMMALASQRIVMGRQSQLGPIDAQLIVGQRQVSAGAVLAQFDAARTDITQDVQRAAYWAPVLQSLGPALHQEAKYALEYGQHMVTGWLRSRMCAQRADPEADAMRIAEYFNTTDQHKHHGRRIDRVECRAQGVDVEDLEPDQQLQEAVLSTYHFLTLFVEAGPAMKLWINQNGTAWIKNAP